MTQVESLTIYRPLTAEEVVLYGDELVALAQEFHDEGSALGKFNGNTFIEAWSNYVRLEMGTFIAAIEEGRILGFIGGLIYPDALTGELHASEAFWFVSKSHRGAGKPLFYAFEQWAKDRGAARMSMVHLENDESNTRLSEFYIKNGYRKIETTYAKEVV